MPINTLIRPSLSGSLATGSSLVFGARAAGAVVMLLVQIVIARQLGVAAAGRVATGLTVMAFLAVLGRYGTDQLILRRVAVHDDGSRVREEYLAAIAVCAPFLILLGAALFCAAGTIASSLFHDPRSAVALRWMAIGLPFFGTIAVQGEALKGLGASFVGAAVQSLVGPVVTLLVLVAAGGADSLQLACAALCLGFVAASAAAHVAWHRSCPPADPERQAIAARSFMVEAWPFFGTSVLTLVLIYAPVLALAASGSADDVARYFAADRWTQIPSMLLVAVNATVGPRFARYWASARADDVRDLLRRSGRASAALSICVGVGLIGGAPWLLDLFGAGYTDAVPALRILALGQAIVLLCGPVSSLLVMSGGERSQRTATGMAALLVLALCALLVPRHGIVGAAIASSAAMALSRVIILVLVTRRMNSSLPVTTLVGS